VSEHNQAGYSAGTWGGDCASDGSIDLQVGDNKTCTITNDDLPPELKIVKTAMDPMTIPGATLTYSITVTNIGGGDALDVTLNDPLPPSQNGDENLEALPWTTDTAGCSIVNDGWLLTCDIGTLAKDPTPDQVESGDEASFTVVYSVSIPDDYLVLDDQPSGSGTLGSRFEIDGNLVDDAESSALDWGSPELALINVWDAPLIDLSPDYYVDNAFSDGAKENDPVPVVVDHSIPPNKSDLTNFLIAQDDVDGSTFLALAWIRTDSLGTSNFDFELNQLAQLSGNGVTPVRKTGDVLFSFDFESSGNVVMLSLREWDGDAGNWGEPRTLNIEGTGYAAINDPELFGTVSNGEINPFLGEAMPDQSFGEAVINVTQTFQTECRTFVNAFVKGRSSTPFTAALKDFIAPIGVNVDTCRTIPLVNEATADASNPGQDPVEDGATATLTNDPIYAGDPDNDGIANYIDPDDDNDGVADEDDAFQFDPTEWSDSDGDGVGDNGDAFPDDPAEWADSDGDGVGDSGDPLPFRWFEDVPESHWAFNYVEALARSGITNGCSETPRLYCPEELISRAQMAVFIVRGIHGSDFVPPPATGEVFQDVSAEDFAAAFIEQFYRDGITRGCATDMFCPNRSVTRAEIAIFLLRAKHGAEYAPPPATGIFDDVPLDHWAAAWIEQFSAEGITSGCGNGNYCPDEEVTRAQMAVHIIRTFDL
jgi:uncharacterized repeat protein (TIGR01451 family)